MNRANYWLLVPTIVAVLVGCGANASNNDEAAAGSNTSDLIPADDDLKADGVAYLRADGTMEHATITYFNEAKAVIGGAQVNGGHAEIRWKGIDWDVESQPKAGGETIGQDADDEADQSALKRNGIVVTDNDARQAFEEANDVLDHALDHANLRSESAQAEGLSCIGHNVRCYQGAEKFGAAAKGQWYKLRNCCSKMHCVRSPVKDKKGKTHITPVCHYKK